MALHCRFGFGVTIAALKWETEVCPIDFSLSRQGWSFGVATQSLGVATGSGWLGSFETECT